MRLVKIPFYLICNGIFYFSHLLHRDCLIPIATAVALSGVLRSDKPCATITVTGNGPPVTRELTGGELYRFPVPPSGRLDWQIEPRRGVDAGNGPGLVVNGTSLPSAAGLIIDTRGRPLLLPQNCDERCALLRRWLESVEAYSFSSDA